MKKAICFILCACMILSLSPTVYAQKPVIQGLINGQTVNGDTEIFWEQIKNAQYYTVNVRYIQNADDGPLAYAAVKTEKTSFTLEKSVMDSLGKGAYRVCVASYINDKPYYSEVVVYTYTDVVSPLSGKRVVCFGDSLTANGIWEKQLSARFGTSFINAGVGGTTTETSLERFEKDVIAQNPHITLICFAYNDAVKINRIASRVSLERYRENLVFYITSLKNAGSDVVLFSPNPVIEEYFNANPLHPGEDYIEDGGINSLISKYTDIMKQTAEEYGVYYVDLNKAFGEKDVYSLMNKDGTHPNHKGYELYAKVLGDFLESTYTPEPEPEYVLGDINGNGQFDISDYLSARRMISKTMPMHPAADSNGDKSVDQADLDIIKQLYIDTRLKGE